MTSFDLRHGDVLDQLRLMPDESVHCVVTSPPYWGLRSYLPKDHADKAKEIGHERTPEEWAARLVEVFREVRRVLRSDGTLWLNVGDAWITKPHGHSPTHDPKYKAGRNRDSMDDDANRANCRETLFAPADPPSPCVVLDPFAGAGTTGLEANALGRDFIGIELYDAYIGISETRKEEATA